MRSANRCYALRRTLDLLAWHPRSCNSTQASLLSLISRTSVRGSTGCSGKEGVRGAKSGRITGWQSSMAWLPQHKLAPFQWLLEIAVRLALLDGPGATVKDRGSGCQVRLATPQVHRTSPAQVAGISSSWETAGQTSAWAAAAASEAALRARPKPLPEAACPEVFATGCRTKDRGQDKHQ